MISLIHINEFGNTIKEINIEKPESYESLILNIKTKFYDNFELFIITKKNEKKIISSKEDFLTEYTNYYIINKNENDLEQSLFNSIMDKLSESKQDIYNEKFCCQICGERKKNENPFFCYHCQYIICQNCLKNLNEKCKPLKCPKCKIERPFDKWETIKNFIGDQQRELELLNTINKLKLKENDNKIIMNIKDNEINKQKNEIQEKNKLIEELKKQIENLKNKNIKNDVNIENNIVIKNNCINNEKIKQKIIIDDNESGEIKKKNNNNNINFILPVNEIACTKCKNNIVNTNYNICSECLFNEIINKLYSLYIKFVENNNDKKSFEFPNYFLINGKSYASKKLFDEFNNSSNDKKNIFDENKLIQNLKKKICIFCTNDINNKPKLVLPCGCCLCIKEIDEFFIQRKPLNEKDHFICVCGEEYSRFQIFQLGISLENLNLKLSIQNIIVNYLNLRLNSFCCFCGEKRKADSTFNKIDIRNSALNCVENTKESKRFLSYLIHNMCQRCWRAKKTSSIFKCGICNVNHEYIS